MVKAYERINWKNDQKPAINDVNLNKMDSALNEIDNRVVQLANETSPYENRFVNQTIPQVNPTIKDSADGKFIYMNNKGYTQQDGTPTPDAPIHISANGDKGYFDGDLKQGNYATADGSFVSSTNFVSSQNGIPCNRGDEIEIKYEVDTAHIIIFYYNESGYVSSERVYGVSSLKVTIPENVTYFHITIGTTDTITPSTAKHICVTINGQYALRVKTCGKNLYNINGDVNRRPDGTLLQYNTVSNSVLTSNCDRGLNRGSGQIIPCVKGKKYVISVEVVNLGSGNDTIIFFGDETNYKHVKALGVTSLEFIPTTDTLYVECSAYSGTGAQFTNIQVELDTITDYEPHQESEALIPTSSPFYEGDYIEVYADGSGREYRVRKSVVYNGSDEEAWVHNSNNGTVFLKLSDAKNANRYVLCSHFKSVGSFSVIENNIFIEANGNLLICASEFSNATEWKTWLQSNPIHVVYELATPTSTPLTQEQVAEFRKLRTYKGVTYVTADGEVVMRYYCNTDSGDSVSRLQNKVIEVDNKLIAVTIPFYNDSIAPNTSRTVTIPQEYLDEGYALVSILEKYKYYMKWEVLGADTLKVTNLYEGDTSIYVPTVDVLLAKVK